MCFRQAGALSEQTSFTPYYDITFSQSAEPYKRRRRTDHYEDFRMLADEPDEDIVFFGGKGYLALFGETDRCDQKQEDGLLQIKGCSPHDRLHTPSLQNDHLYKLALSMRQRLPRRSSQNPIALNPR